MSHRVIRAVGLGKTYQVGHKQEVQPLFKEEVTRALVSGLHQLATLGRGQRGDGAKSDDMIWALKDVSFEVAQGEVVGIIGRNGAGKSTLLKILSRVTELTTGYVEIHGRVSSLLEVGTGFHPDLTGRENVFLNGTILGMKTREIRRKFDAIVDFAEIERFIDTPVKYYSSGMYLRLAFAIAAHLDAEIQLLDEVLAVGDTGFQNKCLGKMRDIAHEGRTVLFVSHDMSAIQRFCPRTLLIDGGHLVVDADTPRAVEAYLASGSDTADAEIELGALPRERGLGQVIRLTRGGILNAHGETTNRVSFDQPFTVSLEAQASSRLRDLVVVIGIDNFLEQRITTVNSADGNLQLDVSPAQLVRLGAQFNDLRLIPGAYSITVTLQRGREILDHISRGISLEISEVGYRERQLPNSTRGIIHSRPDWRQEQ